MKYFKTENSRLAKRYKITKQEFSKVTERKYPFEQKNSQGVISQYGICPSCLNPIQLIGVIKEIKRNPYGKHTGKDIEGLPKWNQIKYEYCPYAVKNDHKSPNDEELITEIDDNIVELYNLLKNQFDRVIFIIEKELKIKCSIFFWEKALRQFCINQFYLYPWLTESNLPYIFAYFGLLQQKVYKQKVLIGSEIYNTLSNYTGIEFIQIDNRYAEISNKKGCFINLYFRFVDHQQQVSEGEELKECMLFCIDDRNNGETIFEQKIEFSETYFSSVINKQENSKKRNYKLLEIAKKLMPDLKDT